VIELSLPMKARLVEANPYVEEARNHAAVVRGPIVYCVESVDLPEGVRVMDVAIRRGTRLEPGTARGLDGVPAVRGEGAVTAQDVWRDALYRDVESRTEMRTVPLTLVPYFAWDNR